MRSCACAGFGLVLGGRTWQTTMPTYKIIGADGREYRGVTEEQLRTWILENRANAQTRVQVEGTTEWRSLGDIAEFVEPLGGAPAAPETICLGPSPTPKTNSMAITGLVMGILSVTCCLVCIGLPCNILGLIFSGIGLSQIQKDPARHKGQGIAIAGLVLSVLSFFVWLALCRIIPSAQFLQKLREMQQQ